MTARLHSYKLRTVPDLNDFRVLGTIVPPNDRVAPSEVADVLTALIAYAHYGQPIFDAAHAGVQAVHDFYYDVIARDAEAKGLPAPQKGAPVIRTSDAVAPGGILPGQQVSPQQFADLARQVKLLTDLLIARTNPETPAEVTPAGSGETAPQIPTTDPAPVTTPAPDEAASAEGGEVTGESSGAVPPQVANLLQNLFGGGGS